MHACQQDSVQDSAHFLVGMLRCTRAVDLRSTLHPPLRDLTGAEDAQPGIQCVFHVST
jgi:hypothetical protein